MRKEGLTLQSQQSARKAELDQQAANAAKRQELATADLAEQQKRLRLQEARVEQRTASLKQQETTLVYLLHFIMVLDWSAKHMHMLA